MRAIATAHPGCRITALAHPKRAEVLRGLPFVARVGGITKNTAPWRGRHVPDEIIPPLADRAVRRLVGAHCRRMAARPRPDFRRRRRAGGGAPAQGAAWRPGHALCGAPHPARERRADGPDRSLSRPGY